VKDDGGLVELCSITQLTKTLNFSLNTNSIRMISARYNKCHMYRNTHPVTGYSSRVKN